MTARRRIDGRLPDVKQIGRRPDQRQNGDGFWPAPITVCQRCGCLLPATDRAKQLHRAHHETLAGLEQDRPR
jgi:hypothetical protein